MDWNGLDKFLRAVTPREQFYLDNPGAPSPRYKDIERRVFNGREVLYFALQDDMVHLRKDSRFTDVPYHLHTNVNVNYIYSGKCDFVVDELPVTLRKGDVAIFDVDVVRRKLYLGEDDIVINLNMSHDFFESSFMRKAGEQTILSDFMLRVLSTSSPAHDHYMIFRTGDNAAIDLLFRQLMLEYFEENIYREQMIQGYLHLIFLELLRLYDSDANKHFVQIGSTHSRDIMSILYYIEQNAADCTLTELAEHFRYHPKYISALLKQMTGSTFKQIQTRQRLKNAATLLLQTALPIQEIAQRVGVGNLSSFYRSFEAQYRVLPGTYRKMQQSQPLTAKRLPGASSSL